MHISNGRNNVVTYLELIQDRDGRPTVQACGFDQIVQIPLWTTEFDDLTETTISVNVQDVVRKGQSFHGDPVLVGFEISILIVVAIESRDLQHHVVVIVIVNVGIVIVVVLVLVVKIVNENTVVVETKGTPIPTTIDQFHVVVALLGSDFVGDVAVWKTRGLPVSQVDTFWSFFLGVFVAFVVVVAVQDCIDLAGRLVV